MKKMMVGSLIVIGNLIVQFGLAYLVIKMFILPNLPAKEAAQPATKQEDELSVQLDHLAYEKSPLTLDELEKAAVLPIDNIVINPSNTRARRFLVMSIEIYYFSEKPLQNETVAKVVVKDAINMWLSRKTVEWLTDARNRAVLREEIKAIARKILKSLDIKEVFITKYVMQ